jgi:hypothetical protein
MLNAGVLGLYVRGSSFGRRASGSGGAAGPLAAAAWRLRELLPPRVSKGLGALLGGTSLLGRRRFMLTKTLEWNLHLCILDAMFDEHFHVKQVRRCAFGRVWAWARMCGLESLIKHASPGATAALLACPACRPNAPRHHTALPRTACAGVSV